MEDVLKIILGQVSLKTRIMTRRVSRDWLNASLALSRSATMYDVQDICGSKYTIALMIQNTHEKGRHVGDIKKLVIKGICKKYGVSCQPGYVAIPYSNPTQFERVLSITIRPGLCVPNINNLCDDLKFMRINIYLTNETKTAKYSSELHTLNETKIKKWMKMQDEIKLCGRDRLCSKRIRRER